MLPKIASKRYAGLTCPHGLKFYFVDGMEIRRRCYGDFVLGGNGYRYPTFCSKKELWLEKTIDEKELPFIAFHECHETELMREGKSYAEAHESAKRYEDSARRHKGPILAFIKAFFTFPAKKLA